MLNLQSIINDDLQIQTDNISNNISFLDDLTIWIDKFNINLKELRLSSNTIESYRYVLKALVEYSERYLHTKKHLYDFTVEESNDFLLWMENYQINRDYGSLKERTAELLHFIEYIQSQTNKDIFILRNKYINTHENSKLDMNFILDEFEKYYFNNEIAIDKIDNNYIKNYIVNDSKTSVATMMHRRAVLHKFINFISEKSDSDVFDYLLKNMKIYKKEKGVIYKSKTFDKELLLKLINFIDAYVDDPSIFIKRVTQQSKTVAYKNTAMILLMLGAGCRASEALSLRFCDIEDSNKDTYKVNILNGKGNKHRTSYILKSLFKKHYDYLNNVKNTPDDYISTNSNGNKLDRKNLFKTVEKIFKFIGEDKKGLHIFRHHFGSSFAENNGNMKILQDLLGHSVITTTMIYSGVGESAKERAVAGV